MASTLLLKRRIKTAQNVSKTTRAMQMIAASKLKRAQNATLSSRPYVEKLTKVNTTITGLIDKESLHPYMKNQSDQVKKLLLVIAPDKGLCGAMVTNVLKEYARLPLDAYYIVSLGKKVEKSLSRLGGNLIASFLFGNTLPSFDMVFPLVAIIDDYFLQGKVQSVEVLYTHFSSVFTQKPTISQLLPLTPVQQIEEVTIRKVLLFEPSPKVILPLLLKHYLEMRLHQYLLENYVSEQGARMIAMQNATDNAKDIIEALRLEYNKARQTRITNEILDISSAANALYA